MPSGAWPRPADVSSSGTHPLSPSGPRPPALASTMLEEDLAPRCPGRSLMRRIGLGLGFAGAVAVAAVAWAHPVGWALAAGLALAGGVGASPLPYDRRARWVLTLAATLAAGALGWRLATGAAPPEAVLRIGAVAVGATAMLHRAHHRSSRTARALAAAGLALSVAWLATGSGLDALVVHRDTVAGWTPALLRVSFVAAAALGALVFMAPTTTAGTERWWPLLPGWLLVYEVAGQVLRGEPLGAGMASAVALSCAVALAVVAWAQRLAARDCGERARRAAPAPSDRPAPDALRPAA